MEDLILDANDAQIRIGSDEVARMHEESEKRMREEQGYNDVMIVQAHLSEERQVYNLAILEN